MFLGLNIGARLTHYALTEDGAHFIQGTVTLEHLPHPARHLSYPPHGLRIHGPPR